jgi:exosome complex RNA-binding protein Csl4
MAYRSRHITKEIVATGTLAAATYVLWRAPVACKVTAVRAYRVGGSGAVVNAQKNATDLATDKSITSADTWMAATLSTTAADLRLAAGDTLKAEIVSVAGSPTALTIQVDVVLDSNA